MRTERETNTSRTMLLDLFHLWRGLFRRLKRFAVIRICSYFPTITMVLLVTAFWHPLRALTIFSLLFFATMMGLNVSIRPLTVGNFFRGLRIWLCFLYALPEDEEMNE
jgi:hypothetical protein